MSAPEDKRLRNIGAESQAGDFPGDERWSLVQRVVQHDSFRRAPRLRELLLFITARAIEGRVSDLTENEIAAAVFGRSRNFNSSDDSIVRSSVRQLRTKLHEYFAGPGSEEPAIIEIPKGNYVPEFPARAVALRMPPGGPAAGESAPGGDGGRSVPRWWRSLALVCALAAAVCGVLLVRRGTPAATPRAGNLFTLLFGGRGEEVTVVLCDSALVVVNAHRPRIVSLDEYIQGGDQLPLPLPRGRAKGATPPEFPGRRLITSFRDLFFVERLGELSATNGFQVALKHSRLLQARDFRTGNYVLLGSSWSNPWTVLFEEQLNFRFRESESSGVFGVENRSPMAGERPFYQSLPAESRNGVSYARISVAPNLAGEHAILIVSGLHTESSEGALDAVLSPGFLEQLRRAAGVTKREDLIGVEVLIEVRAVDGVVRGTRLLASRKHPRG